jgi:hypothetical protein
MSRPWFIDSIDVRGGLAFASQREGNMKEASRLHRGPSVFISAPSFQPEPIINAALAAGAARRGMQEGLFLARGEIPFETADVVAEFARRAYVAAAGRGNGEGGNGQDLPPEPEPGPQEPSDGFAEAVHLVLSNVAEFSEYIDRIQTVGRSQPFDWFNEYTCKTVHISALAKQGLRLTLQLLTRNAPDRLAEWVHDSVSRRIGPFPRAILTALRSERSIRNLLGATPLPGPWPSVFFEPYVHPWISTDVGDPVDSLTSIPLPQSIATHLGLHPAAANVYSLLLRVMASPLVILTGSELQSEQLLSLTVFAAAHIVSRREPLPGSADESATLISRWLRAQLPSIAFHRSVEELITTEMR